MPFIKYGDNQPIEIIKIDDSISENIDDKFSKLKSDLLTEDEINKDKLEKKRE